MLLLHNLVAKKPINYKHMKKILSNISQKLTITSLVIKVAFLSILVFSLPQNVKATESLEISNIEISVDQGVAVISWRTNINATGRIDYGLTTDYGLYIDDTSADSRQHEVRLSGLERDVRYHFMLTSQANGETVYTYDSIFDTEDFSDAEAPELSRINRPYTTGTRVVLQWETDELATCKVYYGTSTEYGKTKSISGKKEIFQVIIDKLEPNTEYYYKVEAKDKYGNTSHKTNSFRTLVNDEEDREVLAISRITPINNTDEGISYTAADVTWRANKLASGVVYYGTSPDRLNKKVSTDNTWLKIDQSVHLTKLKSDTLYYFRVEAKDIFGKKVKSPIFSFKTKYLVNEVKPASVNAKKLYTKASALFKTTGNQIFAILNNQKYRISNEEIFKRYGYSTKNIKNTTPQALANIKDAKLIKDAVTNKVYYLAKKGPDKYLKIALPSPTVFSSYQSNKWSDVVTVASEDLANYNDVKLVKTKNSKAVYLLVGGVKKPFTSAKEFESQGYKWSDILEVSQTHLDTYQTAS